MNDSSISSKREERKEGEGGRRRNHVSCKSGSPIWRIWLDFFDDYSTPLAGFAIFSISRKTERFPRKTTAPDKSRKADGFSRRENLMEL